MQRPTDRPLKHIHESSYAGGSVDKAIILRLGYEGEVGQCNVRAGSACADVSLLDHLHGHAETPRIAVPRWGKPYGSAGNHSRVTLSME